MTSWDGSWPPGWTVEHVAVTGSTNADLVAATGRSDRHVLVADHQTAGRGRLDRTWDAPPGTNLLASLLLASSDADPGALVRRVSLAALDACRQAAPAVTGDRSLTLKWPNDLLLEGLKLAGVLAQRRADGAVVVGVGLNVGWCPPGAARLGDGTDRADLLGLLLAAFDRIPAGAAELAARYRDELGTLGKVVRVERPAGLLVGTAVDVDDDGRLVIVDESGSRHRLEAGDVTHLR